MIDLVEAYAGPVIDEFYRRLLDRDYAQADPKFVMLTADLMHVSKHDNRGDGPTEVLLMAAWGKQGKLDRPSVRVIRWRNRASSGRTSLGWGPQEQTIPERCLFPSGLGPLCGEDIKPYIRRWVARLPHLPQS